MPFLQKCNFSKFLYYNVLRRFAFFFLPSRLISRRSSDLHQIRHECATLRGLDSTDFNQIWHDSHERVFLLRTEEDEGDLRRVLKPGRDCQKHRKIGQFFTKRSGFFLQKSFWTFTTRGNIFQQMPQRQFRTVMFFLPLGAMDRQRWMVACFPFVDALSAHCIKVLKTLCIFLCV